MTQYVTSREATMPTPKNQPRTTTAVVLTTKQLDLVRRAALIRAVAGTAIRVSVSDIVREALSAYTPKLEAEMVGFESFGKARGI